jgi:predicted secreted hydrolase
MNRKRRYGTFVALALLGVISCVDLAISDPGTFQRARPGYEWSFPRDHGPHNGFQTEWWYYTGHLYREGASPFGTLQRTASSSPSSVARRPHVMANGASISLTPRLPISRQV